MVSEYEKFSVHVSVDKKSGQAISEFWTQNGNRHRLGGPALSQWHPETRVLIREEYFRYDQRHREDGPAVIHRDGETGKVVSESWYQHGELHRDCGSVTHREIDPITEALILEEFWEAGRLHRETGPAIIQRDRTSAAVVCQKYYFDGKEHFDTGFMLDLEP